MRFNLIRKNSQEALRDLYTEGRRRFAWFPVRLEDGSSRWLEYYWEYPDVGVDHKGNNFIWSSSPEDFKPMYFKYANKIPVVRRIVPSLNGKGKLAWTRPQDDRN